MSLSKNAVNEMIGPVIELTRSRAIWWELFSRQNCRRFKKMRMAYPNFFASLHNSLQLAFFVITHQLFDTRRDTKSLRRLIKELEFHDATLARQLETKVSAQAQLLEKVCAIRHNVYAHRNKLKPPVFVFAHADLKVREMKPLVFLAQDVVSTLADAAGSRKKAEVVEEFRRSERYAKDEAFLILQEFERHAR